MSAEFLYLTTVGRVTGRPREIELWFTELDGRSYLVAEHGERANWVRNLRAEPRVRARVGDRTFDATARVVDIEREPDLCRVVRAASERKYGWGNGLVIEILPDTA